LLQAAQEGKGDFCMIMTVAY